jgi:hypothetical protein
MKWYISKLHLTKKKAKGTIRLIASITCLCSKWRENAAKERVEQNIQPFKACEVCLSIVYVFAIF